MSKKNTFFSWFNTFKKKIDNNIENKNNDVKQKKSVNFFKKIQIGIQNTKNNFAHKIKKFFLMNAIDDHFFIKLEEQLITFDFGIKTSQKIISILIDKYQSNQLKNENDVYRELKKILLNIVQINTTPKLKIYSNVKNTPYVILLIGANGVGKTTTIAKLACMYKKIGKSVILSASDSFRAAAIEQLMLWGEKISIPVFNKKYGTDSSAIIFDSIEFAQNNQFDILIIDTAGRLHNKIHLMEELKKNIRVINKKIISAPHEILLVLDACSGQNSFTQTKIFLQELKLITGIVITKLDGTAKGGIIFSIVKKFSIPIQYLSTGEQLEDFHLFDAHEFIENMFAE